MERGQGGLVTEHFAQQIAQQFPLITQCPPDEIVQFSGAGGRPAGSSRSTDVKNSVLQLFIDAVQRHMRYIAEWLDQQYGIAFAVNERPFHGYINGWIDM